MNQDRENLAAPQAGDKANGNINPISIIDSVAPAGWKVKLTKAFAQLMLGTEKGAAIYADIRERRDTIEGRTIVSTALANAVAAQAMGNPEVMARAQARFLGDLYQEQENFEAVLLGTPKYLCLTPPPVEADAEEIRSGQSADEHTGKDHGAINDDPLNGDWAATFARIAQSASTEELRDRLSRVLAGELASPGRYSRATIRAISELEKADLEEFQKVMTYVLGHNLVRTSSDDLKPSVSDLIPLSDAGLILDANAMLSASSPPAISDAQTVFFGGIEWGLVVFFNKGNQFNLPIVPLTRAGAAVVDLLGRPDERPILRRIADEIPKDSYSKILMGRKVGENSIGPQPEQLFPKSNHFSNKFSIPATFGG